MKKFSIEIKWAIIFSLLIFLWMIIEQLFGLHDKHIDKHAFFSGLFSIPAIGLFIFAIRDKKMNFYNGKITFNQGFVSGIILSIFIALLSPIGQYIVFTFISPNFFEHMINYVVLHKIQTQEVALNYFTINNYIIQGVYGSLSMGIVTAAIVSYFLKNKSNKN